jgi:hypothetical protein
VAKLNSGKAADSLPDLEFALAKFLYGKKVDTIPFFGSGDPFAKLKYGKEAGATFPYKQSSELADSRYGEEENKASLSNLKSETEKRPVRKDSEATAPMKTNEKIH